GGGRDRGAAALPARARLHADAGTPVRQAGAGRGARRAARLAGAALGRAGRRTRLAPSSPPRQRARLDIPQAIAKRLRAARRSRAKSTDARQPSSRLPRHLRGNAIVWSIPQAIAKRLRASRRSRAKSTDSRQLSSGLPRHLRGNAIVWSIPQAMAKRL